MTAFAPSIKRMSTNLVLVLVLFAVLATVLAGPAAASSGGSSQPASAPACAPSMSESVSEDILLPVNRWSGVNGFHSRTSSGFMDFSFLNELNRDMVAGFMLWLGNGIWSGTSGMASWATRFCIMDTAGTSIDREVGGLVNDYLLRGEGIAFVSAILVLVAVRTIWTASRRGSMDWRPIASKAVVVALLAIMGIGASNTDPDRGTFGAGSPGWIITNVNNTITSMASAPTIGSAQSAVSMPSNPDQMSCETYSTQLAQMYQAKYDTTIMRSQTAIPVVLNSIWEQTGLEAWKQAQFGTTDHGEMVYCRLLDDLAGVPVGQLYVDPAEAGQAGQSGADLLASQQAVLGHYWDGPAPAFNAAAYAPTDTISRDASLVAWAACQPSGGGWSYRGGSGGQLVADDRLDPDDPNSCEGWWTTPSTHSREGFGASGSAFDWGTDTGDIRADIDNADARDFVLSLRADSSFNATQSAFFYLLSSIAMFVVFGMLSLVIIAAKFVMVALMLVMVVVMIASLLPNANVSERLGSLGKQLLGVILLSSGAVFIFAVIGMLTSASINAGENVFNPGGVMAMMWAAASPILAVVTLHWVFKRVLKVASPFTAGGAMAWAGGSAAVGGAVGGLVGGGVAHRMAGRAAGGAKSAGKRAASGAVHKATGGRLGHASGERKGVSRTGLVTPKRKGQAPDHQRTTAAGEAIATGRSAKHNTDGSTKTRRQLKSEQDASEKQMLAEAGREDLSQPGHDARERKQVLKSHRKEQVTAAQGLTKDKWAQRNGDSIRASIAARRAGRAAATPEGIEGRRKIALRDVAGGVKDWGAGRAKDARRSVAAKAQVFRDAPVRSVGRAAGKTIRTGAKVSGAVLAASLVPGAAPVVAGAYLTRKAWKSNTAQRRMELAGDRLGGHQQARMKLQDHARRQAQEKEQQEGAPGPEQQAPTQRQQEQQASEEQQKPERPQQPQGQQAQAPQGQQEVAGPPEQQGTGSKVPTSIAPAKPASRGRRRPPSAAEMAKQRRRPAATEPAKQPSPANTATTTRSQPGSTDRVVVKPQERPTEGDRKKGPTIQ